MRRKRKQSSTIDEPSLFSPEEMAEMLAVKSETIDISSFKKTEQKHDSAKNQTPAITEDSDEDPVLSGDKENSISKKNQESVDDIMPADDNVNGDRMVNDMIMAMGLLDAYFTPSQTRLIAMESATLAQNGIKAGQIYELPAIKDRRFDGNQLIAIYYVSFARSFPSMIDRINLPLSDAYAEALEKYKE